MNYKCFYLFIILLVLVSCSKDDGDSSKVLEYMELSESTLSQFPYQQVDSICFTDSLGNKIYGFVNQGNIEEKRMNHHVYGEVFSYKFQSQTVTVEFPAIELSIELVFSARYNSPQTDEKIEDMIIWINDLNKAESTEVLRMITNPRNTNEETINSHYGTRYSFHPMISIMDSEYRDVWQGYSDPNVPVNFFYNSDFGVLQFEDQNGIQWCLFNE